MRNSTTVGIVLVAVLLALCFGVAFAGNEKMNDTKSANMTNITENMTNVTANATLAQNMTNATKPFEGAKGIALTKR